VTTAVGSQAPACDDSDAPRDHRPVPHRTRVGRPAPHDPDAEEALLGAMLLTSEAIEAGMRITSAEHFYNPANGLVFTGICRLHARGERADPVTVGGELRRLGRLEEAGGAGRLLALQSCPCTGAAPAYGASVAELRPSHRPGDGEAARRGAGRPGSGPGRGHQAGRGNHAVDDSSIWCWSCPDQQ